jgi:endonuclease/exonuclease/phosphatase family metal-dependent hydrolase
MSFPMRIATYNVRHCEGMDGVVDVARVARAVAETGAELVALQELDRGLPRSDELDQPRALAEATGMHVFFGPTLHRHKGDYGIGIASKAPLDVEVVALPRVGDEEPRAFLQATYRGVTVIATHLTRDRAARSLQLDALASAARAAGARVVVMGDLNVEPRALGPLEHYARCEGLPTLPARRPRRQIDHVLAGTAVTIVECSTIVTEDSDHRPLVAQLVVDE